MILALAIPLVGFGPAVGAGFQRDDFRWLWHARMTGGQDLVRLLTEHLGFYRPVTSLSWAVDLLRDGPDPVAFGLTNLLMHVVALALFGLVVARMTEGEHRGPAALVATLLAAMSHHYSRTAVLWISGRGALLGALFGTAAILAWDGWLRGRGGLARALAACGLSALAAFSYEAAIGVTGLMAMLVFLRGRADRRHPGWATLPLWVLGFYAVIRSWLGAMQPWAPRAGYGYRPGAVPVNLLEYSARAAVPGLILVILLLLLAVACGAAPRVAKACGQGVAGVLPVGAAWFLLGILPALPVPRRSDLYAYFAALGVHLLAATAVARGFLELESTPRTRGRARIGGVAVILLLALAWPPWAWGRNARLAHPARLAMEAVAELRRAPLESRAGDCWIFRDRRELAPDLHDAFSSHLPWVVGFVRRGPPEMDAWWAGERRDDGWPTRCRRLVRVRLLESDARGEPLLEVEVDMASRSAWP